MVESKQVFLRFLVFFGMFEATKLLDPGNPRRASDTIGKYFKDVLI